MKKGITVVEILIVIAIIFLLTTIVFVALKTFKDKQILNSETEKIVSTIQDARNRTLASVDDTSYGVHIASTSVTLFRGIMFSLGSSTNEVLELNSSVEVGGVSLEGGGTEIVFERLTGSTLDYGSVSLDLVSGSSTKNILIDPGGFIYAQ
jgi:hypothetical protein